MLRRRDPVAIESVGKYLNTCGKDLASLKTRMNQLIDHIHDNYVGADAESIVTNFKNETNKIDTFLESNDYFQSYMGEVSVYDTETVDTFRKDMQDVTDYFNSNKVDDPNVDTISVNSSNSDKLNLATYLSETESTNIGIDPSGKKGSAFAVDLSGKNHKNVTTSLSTTGSLRTSTGNKSKGITTKLSGKNEVAYAIDTSGKKGSNFAVNLSGKNPKNITTVLSTTGSLRTSTGNKSKGITTKLPWKNEVAYAIDTSGKYKRVIPIESSGKNPQNITTYINNTGTFTTTTDNKPKVITTKLSGKNEAAFAIDTSGKKGSNFAVDLSGKNSNSTTTSLSTTGNLTTTTGNKKNGINTYLSETDSVITTKGDDFYE